MAAAFAALLHLGLTSADAGSAFLAWGGLARPWPSGRAPSTWTCITTTASGWMRDLEHGAKFHSRFEDMLPHCDFLSINCASTAETRGIINARALSLLPPDAIVVNAARGDIVDDDALIAALKSGKLAAAGLDVFKGEPNIDPALPRTGKCVHAAASRQCHEKYAHCHGHAGGG